MYVQFLDTKVLEYIYKSHLYATCKNFDFYRNQNLCIQRYILIDIENFINIFVFIYKFII